MITTYAFKVNNQKKAANSGLFCRGNRTKPILRPDGAFVTNFLKPTPIFAIF